MYTRMLATALALLCLAQSKPERGPRGQEVAEADMGTTYWNGTTDDFASAGNWSNGVPTGSDNAIFDGRSQVSPMTNLDRGIDGFRLITTPTFSGDIGTASNRLKWEGIATTTEHVIRGSGSVFVDTLSTTASFVVDSSNLVDALNVTDGIFALYVKRGHVDVVAEATVAQSIVVCGDSASLTIEVDTVLTAQAYIILQAGSVTSRRAIAITTPFIMTGGEWRQEALIDNNHVNLHVLGGRFNYTPSVKTSRSLQFYVGGILDLSENAERVVGIPPIVLPSGTFFREQTEGGYTFLTDLREDYP